MGAGHNGLACAAYLARAGKRVLVVESRERIASFLEEPPGDGFGISVPTAIDLLKGMAMAAAASATAAAVLAFQAMQRSHLARVLLTVLAVLGGTALSLYRNTGVGPLDTTVMEDARVFLADQVNLGFFRALVTPYSGYFHLLPRLLAGIAALFPPDLAAAVMALIVAAGMRHFRVLEKEVVLLINYSVAFIASLTIGSAVLHVIKLVLGRRRPRDDMEMGLYGFMPLAFNSNYNSFPSGHALTICCVAVIFTCVWPQWAPLWFAVAALLAVTRALLTAHFLSDVLIGAGIGLIATREVLMLGFPGTAPGWF